MTITCCGTGQSVEMFAQYTYMCTHSECVPSWCGTWNCGGAPITTHSCRVTHSTPAAHSECVLRTNTPADSLPEDQRTNSWTIDTPVNRGSFAPFAPNYPTHGALLRPSQSIGTIWMDCKCVTKTCINHTFPHCKYSNHDYRDMQSYDHSSTNSFFSFFTSLL
jgi:hypothetical protein